MNRLIPTIALIVSSILITSCGGSSSNVNQATDDNVVNTTNQSTEEISTPTTEETTVSQPSSESKANTTNNSVANTTNKSTEEISTPTTKKTTVSQPGSASKPKTTEVVNKTAKNQPEIVTVKKLVQGDIICYATVVDEQGREHNIGADFDICAEAKKYLNRKVRARYEMASLNDCESNEPCGKTRRELIISQMEILGANSPSKTSPGDTQTLSNGKWTITIGNRDSWSGVNNTGNLTYKGCDDKGNCIKLTGGKVRCRDGKCVTGWVNGNYRYILSTPITEDGNAASTLIVREGNKEILNVVLENTSPSDTQTLSNGKWTITIGNRNSWSGVNNTGNLTYKGCDDKGNCIKLTGGKVRCRDGKCVTGWVNGNYRYILSTPITEDGNAASTLIVREGNKEILNVVLEDVVAR